MLPSIFQDKAWKQEKETNLVDLLILLLKYKWLFLFFILLAGIAAPLYLYVLPSKMTPKVYYYSECTISPYNVLEDKVIVESAGSRIEKLKMILMSRDLTLLEVKENHLPMIRQNLWDEKSQKWVTERLYVWDERSGTLIGGQPSNRVTPEGTATLYIKPQNNILSIGFSSDERGKTIKILDRYLSNISDFYRRRDMAMIKAQQNLYQKQLLNTNDTYFKSRLLEKIIELNDRELRVKNERYYGYDMMDSPYVTEVKPQEQFVKGPSTKKYIMITLLLMMAAFVIAISIAGGMEYMIFIKKNDPERFATLLRYLGFRNQGKKPID